MSSDASEARVTGNPNIIGWDEERRRSHDKGFSMPYVNRESCEANQLSVHVSVIKPGEQAHPPHQHAGEETMYVLAGQAEATIGDETHTIGPGTALFCPEHVLHGLRNNGAESLKYMVIKVRPEFAGSVRGD